jgi:hypothetical protein
VDCCKGKALKSLTRILKDDGMLAVVHFESSEGINRRHETCAAVAHDCLHAREEMEALFRKLI